MVTVVVNIPGVNIACGVACQHQKKKKKKKKSPLSALDTGVGRRGCINYLATTYLLGRKGSRLRKGGALLMVAVMDVLRVMGVVVKIRWMIVVVVMVVVVMVVVVAALVDATGSKATRLGQWTQPTNNHHHHCHPAPIIIDRLLTLIPFNAGPAEAFPHLRISASAFWILKERGGHSKETGWLAARLNRMHDLARDKANNNRTHTIHETKPNEAVATAPALIFVTVASATSAASAASAAPAASAAGDDGDAPAI